MTARTNSPRSARVLRIGFGAAVVTSLVVGCGAGSVRLSRDEYARLPHDAQQEVFDAENDVVISKNREDAAREHQQRLERERSELDDAWKRTEKRLSASGASSRIGTARKTVDAHRAFLKAELDVADLSIKVARRETERALVRLDLVRQRQLARIGRVSVASLKEYEQRASEAEKRVKDARAADMDLRVRAQAQLVAWKNAEDEYARSTGDNDTGVWID